MGGAWEVSGVLATVCPTLDFGTPDPVTSEPGLWSHYADNIFSYADSTEKHHLGERRVGCFNVNSLKLPPLARIEWYNLITKHAP